MLTVETVFRRIEKECRENERAFGPAYQPRWRGGTGALMRGAIAEARGVVMTCEDFRRLVRRLRTEHRSNNVICVTEPKGGEK
jgi:hypothetical protein